MVQVVGVAILTFLALWALTVVNVMRPDQKYRAGNRIGWALLVILVAPIGVPLYWIVGAPKATDR